MLTGNLWDARMMSYPTPSSNLADNRITSIFHSYNQQPNRVTFLSPFMPPVPLPHTLFWKENVSKRSVPISCTQYTQSIDKPNHFDTLLNNVHLKTVFIFFTPAPKRHYSTLCTNVPEIFST